MRLTLHGGFGEKGRTCIGVESGGTKMLLDAGIKTSSHGRDDFYPALSPADLASLHAILITHGHEDHVAALGWCIANGFKGRIFMTPETQVETHECLAAYATPEHAALVRDHPIADLVVGVDALTIGPLRLSTGRSGHAVGGVWCVVDDGRVRFGYCGDIAASPILPLDPLPACNALALDASYGDDDVSLDERCAQILAWVAAHAQGCVLPTPLYGRSLELLAALPRAVGLAPGMRDALRMQIDAARWLARGAGNMLDERLAAAIDWQPGEPLPRRPLLCHDGMGMRGPAREILVQARAARHPVLFTGHVPARSPGEGLVQDGLAEWIRLPTHPTLAQNTVLAAATGAQCVLGHSCEQQGLARLARRIEHLRADARTGDTLEL